MSGRVGAIDCGTNSIRLLIADLDDHGGLTDVLRRMEIVRLGQGVDVTGSIAPDAMERTLGVARAYAAQCTDSGARSVRFVATSASRDASNAADFVTGVRKAFAAYSIEPEVISGDQEAALSFLGATGDLRARDARTPYLVVDLGGGSTELVRGSRTVERARSVDIGCVRMTERHLRSDPPTDSQIDAALADIDAALDTAEDAVGFDGIGTLVGLAGSVTTIAAHALELDRYDGARIHGCQLPVERVVEACNSLLHMTREQRAGLPFMHPGRVDVIGAGALVWRTILTRVARASDLSTVTISEKDILDGIALSQHD